MTIHQPSNDGMTTINPINAHYVDWGAIIVGTVLASAISLVLFTFGAGIGLSMVSPYEGEGTSGTAYFMALGLWTLWVILSSFMAGGYITGRLRRKIGDGSAHEVEMRDGAHGLSVWALGIVAGAVLVALGVFGALGGIGQVAGAAAATAGAMTDQNASTLDTLFRSAPSAPLQSASQPLIDGAAPPGAGSVTASPPARDIEADRAETNRLLTTGMVRGELNAENKVYVARLVSSKTGLSQSEAEQRVNTVLADLKRKAEAARKLGILLTFAMAAALLLGAAAAVWSATLGGKHRDEGTDHSRFWSWN